MSPDQIYFFGSLFVSTLIGMFLVAFFPTVMHVSRHRKILIGAVSSPNKKLFTYVLRRIPWWMLMGDYVTLSWSTITISCNRRELSLRDDGDIILETHIEGMQSTRTELVSNFRNFIRPTDVELALFEATYGMSYLEIVGDFLKIKPVVSSK